MVLVRFGNHHDDGPQKRHETGLPLLSKNVYTIVRAFSSVLNKKPRHKWLGSGIIRIQISNMCWQCPFPYPKSRHFLKVVSVLQKLSKFRNICKSETLNIIFQLEWAKIITSMETLGLKIIRHKSYCKHYILIQISFQTITAQILRNWDLLHLRRLN